MRISKAKRQALIALILVVGSLFTMAANCDEGIDDLPRVGDALKISEALESATCQSQGGTWSNKYNTCRK